PKRQKNQALNFLPRVQSPVRRQGCTGVLPTWRLSFPNRFNFRWLGCSLLSPVHLGVGIMSNLSTALKLAPADSQLPVGVYFDEALHQQELELLFKNGPGYAGHELMVPEVGDYHTLRAEDEGRMLVRNAAGVELMSNVCRHRQAIMLNGRGNAQNI